MHRDDRCLVLLRKIVDTVNTLAICGFFLLLLVSFFTPDEKCGYKTCMPTSLAIPFMICLFVGFFTQCILEVMKKKRIGYYKSPIRQRRGRAPLVDLVQCFGGLLVGLMGAAGRDAAL